MNCKLKKQNDTPKNNKKPQKNFKVSWQLEKKNDDFTKKDNFFGH